MNFYGLIFEKNATHVKWWLLNKRVEKIKREIIRKYFPKGMRSAGTVRDVLDIEHGVAIVNVGDIDLGNLSWARETTYGRFSTVLDDVKNSNRLTGLSCDRYEAKCKGESFSSKWDKTTYIAGNRLYIHDTRYTNTTEFKTSLNGVMLYYELAEPVTTQIDNDDLDILRSN